MGKRGPKPGSVYKPRPVPAKRKRGPAKVPKGDVREASPVTLEDAELRSARAKAERLELELAVRRGELIDKAERDRDDFALGRLVRERLLSIPARIAAAVFAAESVAEAQRIMAAEMKQALLGLADAPDP